MATHPLLRGPEHSQLGQLIIDVARGISAEMGSPRPRLKHSYQVRIFLCASQRIQLEDRAGS